MIGYVRRNFFTPIVQFGSIEELNERLMSFSISTSRTKTHPETPGQSRYEVYLKEKESLIQLPFYGFDISSIWGLPTSSATAPFEIFSRPPTIPQIPTNSATPDGATVTSSEVELSWGSSNLDGLPLTYTLLLSNPTLVASPKFIKTVKALAAEGIQLNPVYSGTGTRFSLKNLLSGRTYFWRVDASDPFGTTTQSPIFSFKTLRLAVDKAFNFPNPFNPHKEKTNIVFPVKESQTIEISIYSEFGDLVYKNETNAGSGTNLFVWNGRDNQGNVLFNGSYICTIKKNDGVAKCVILVIK
jgi:hypothetical protein